MISDITERLGGISVFKGVGFTKMQQNMLLSAATRLGLQMTCKY